MKKEVRRKVSSLPAKRRLGGRGSRDDAVLRKQFEERASRSERQLATAQQITHMGSWEWDLGKNHVSWSDELYRIYGLLPRSCEITLEGFLARVHPDDRERIQQSVAQAVESKRPFRYRERIVRADGAIRELDTMGEASFDDLGQFRGLIGTCRDVSEERARERLEEGVHRILEMMASAAPLSATLAALVAVIEAEADGMMASVLLFDAGAERLRVAAAPSLPEPYNRLLDDFPIGPEAGSCGTAAYTRRSVFAFDILVDPLWNRYRFVASEFGLRACWSTPIFAKDGRVIGTFALYYRDPRRPTEQQLALIQRATHIAGIAIERSQMEEQLTALSAHLERAREDERAGISREIHDELGQALTGLKMDLSWLGRHLAAPESEILDRIAAMSSLIDETVNQVRRISAELRPGVLDDLGLRAALEWQAQEFEKRTGTRCAFESSLGDVILSRDASTAVFRICQEALTNVARHAGATRVDITLERQARLLYLAVADNGRGIREEAARNLASLGLLGIRERARRLGGEVEVTTGQAGGTTVRLTVPLEREGQRSTP